MCGVLKDISGMKLEEMLLYMEHSYQKGNQ